MTSSPPDQGVKVKDFTGNQSGSAFSKYRALVYGNTSLAHIMISELHMLFWNHVPGALGLLMRKLLYPALFKQCGKVVFGRNLTFRHTHKIILGDNVIIDDNCMIDAKGENNEGIVIEDDVYIGRNTIIYCKNGNIRIGRGTNISANCEIFSSNDLTIGPGTVIGAYSYFLSGGEYNVHSPTPFAEQSGMETKGPLTIGSNCWFGARVTVLDAATVGDHCVLGAGSVVNKPIQPNTVAVGVPARAIKSL
jgi:acetyltransferase-like isoleucine patch superfamily enzyme